MTDLSGQQLGQYLLLDKLGAGGMATVYRARQESVGRDVAIKVIEANLAENPELIRRFEREAHMIAVLNHPYILKVFDSGRYNDLLYLAMELHPAGNLTTLIREKRLTMPHALRLMEQIAEALDYAHRQGIIHRDMKPQNVLIDSSGNAMLSDFGIAKAIQGESTMLTHAGTVIGTPAYMAPEQWQSNNVDSRADLYAFGIMIYEMLAGQVPFRADTPFQMMHAHIYEPPKPIRTLRPDLPPAVEAVLAKALAKYPHERFANAREMVTTLSAVLGGQSPSTVSAMFPALPVQSPTPRPTPNAAWGTQTGPAVSGYPPPPVAGPTGGWGTSTPGGGVQPPPSNPSNPWSTTHRGGGFAPPPPPPQTARGPSMAIVFGVLAVLILAVVLVILLASNRSDQGGATGGVQAASTNTPLPVVVLPTNTLNSIVSNVTATFSATFTATSTPTFTSSPTATPSSTVTPSPTLTPSPTPSFTPTFTLTPSPSPSFTPSVDVGTYVQQTLNAAQTQTATLATFTPSPDVMGTVQSQLTSIAINTLNAGETATLNAIGSWTKTPTPSRTFTPSRTPSLTKTPSAVPSSTNTRAPTSTRTPVPPRAVSDSSRMIAFARYSDANGEIFIMNGDGSNVRQITNNGADDAGASFSPDSQRIAFHSNRGGNYDIYTMDIYGGNVVQLTYDGEADSFPSWSPDGRSIVFQSRRDGNFNIYVMDADGSNQRPLTSDPKSDTFPTWSPDGGRIAFHTNRTGNFDIATMNADGSNQRVLTDSPTDDTFPAWSPDGNRIVFSSLRDGKPSHLYVMNADGSNVVRLTEQSGRASTWNPASQIVFTSSRDGKEQIYIMSADGSNQRRLTNNPSDDTSPAWSR